jgi:CDP-diacylglycerol---glycerol-3-phosphate 3-phosphatidyltransferase
VIIAREFAVTGLRAVAADRGVVIAASWLGKLKTGLQVVAIFALILLDPVPDWAYGLLYVAVAVTLISGADYFLGLRKRLAEGVTPPATRA